MGHENGDQSAYWDAVADQKTFSHPVPVDWLPREPDAPVLDLGCGYGRTVAELLAAGRTAVVGLDTSRAMLERGRRLHAALAPDLRLAEPGARLPFEDGSFAAVLLLAVLTCIPRDEHQRALLDEARRVLRPGGALIVSDLPLQPGERERARYAQGEQKYGTWGVFELPAPAPTRAEGGGVCRHHDEARFAALAAPGTGLSQEARRELDTVTMNGNPCRIVQLLLRAT